MTHDKAVKILNKHLDSDKATLISWWNRLIGEAEEVETNIVRFSSRTVSGEVKETFINF